MAENESMTTAERLAQVLDQLGIAQAHFCVRSTVELVGLGAAAPQRISSILVSGLWGNPRDMTPFLDRTLWLQGDEGPQGNAILRSLAALPAAQVHRLAGYSELAWSDTVADRTEEMADAMLEFITAREAITQPAPVSLQRDGEVAGVTYEASGSGTPVVLLPLGLSAQQWDPVLPRLQAKHCTIVLGGKHLMPVSLLENRADGDYTRMALETLNLTAPRADESLIEIGCGCGALLRRIAQRTGMPCVAGLDINPFLLREARTLAAADGLADRIELHQGSAEAIPLPDATYDIVFSSTMLEEGDADQMLREMVRIVRPGGRVAVVVRAVDMPFWTNLPLSKELAGKMLAPYGPVTEKGCADGSLTRRLSSAGLQQVLGGPAWAWLQPTGAFWGYIESVLRRDLTATESESWTEVLARARTDGTPISVSQPFHCAVGTK